MTSSHPSDLDRQLAREMERWEAAGLRRRLGTELGAGARPVDFVSNDYLGLARHASLVDAARRALEEHGAGAGASRLLGGGCPAHRSAEAAVAEWLGAEAALLFPSGYQANLGVVSALVGRGDAVFSDARNHASLVDAARLSRAQVHVHRHLDLEELGRQLALARGARRRLVLSEAIFSMGGDGPDLAALLELCARHDAWLLLDEAHSIGVVGPKGAGHAAELEGAALERLAARVVTGGKALGVAGALVVGSSTLREHLVNRARSFVFTTAPTPATAAALAAAVALARDAEAERARLRERATTLAERLALPAPAGAILPWVHGDAAGAVELAAGLAERGLDVRAVRPPTVPEDEAGLRIVVHAFNSEAECDELARALAERSAEQEPVVRAAAPAAAKGEALFVVGTDTGIGKTVVSALLLRAARQRGPAAYWKPVQTGDDSDTESVGTLAQAAGHELLRPAWSLPLPASPHEAAEAAGQAIDPARLEEGLAGLRRTLPDTRLVVELAGGLLVPYRMEPALETQADWLAHSGAPLVLVARSGLGTLNHTLLTLEALRARHLEPRALFLVGEPHASNRRTLERAGGLAAVFEVPWFEEVSGEALEAWLAGQDLDVVFAG